MKNHLGLVCAGADHTRMVFEVGAVCDLLADGSVRS